MTPILQLFVKHPVAGQTKTRLAAGIGHQKALEAYRRLLERVKTIALELKDACDIEVWYGNEMPQEDLWCEGPFTRQQQWGKDIGERMMNSMKQALDHGAGRVVLVGSDLPHLTTDIIRQAYSQLEHHPVVFGPAADGGYYLVGMSEMIPSVFTDMTWSVENVFAESVRRLKQLSVPYATVPTLSDVDTVDDLSGTFLEDLLEL